MDERTANALRRYELLPKRLQGSDLVIEFVSKSDPMVEKLLRNKDDRYEDYDQAFLEECLERHFEIVRKLPLESGTRTLYLGRRRR